MAKVLARAWVLMICTAHSIRKLSGHRNKLKREILAFCGV